MGKLHYKGYTGSIEYSEEDNSFYGMVLGLRKDGISFEGNTADELKKDFEEAVDYYLDSCKSRGKTPETPYSGKLILRIPSLLHGQAADKASSLGISLNEYISRVLQAAVRG